MCGIAGWYALNARPPEEEQMGAMLIRLDHRGPDGTGRHIAGRVGLGMTRLAINDLATGKQPYFSQDGRVVAVFNGEIYNFRELRDDLEKKGYRFRTQADGEVIVALWQEHGASFVEHLNGMFAIALWDGDKLFLCRDRFGAKPLYYTVIDGVLYFASELKALTCIDDFDTKLDHRALRSYLTLEYVPSPHSIYAATKKIEPAHFLQACGSSYETKRYWRLPPFTASGSGTLEEWGGRLYDKLKTSVELQLLSDVPVGVFLSGGLDSSTITALMTEIQPEVVKSFSIGFSESGFDESSYARQVAKALGTEHYEDFLDASKALELIGPLYRQLDEPLADAALIPTYLLSRFASDEVTVVLAGEGADELLGGYPTYLAHLIATPLEHLPMAAFDLLRWLVARLPTSRGYLSLDFKLKKFASGLGYPPVERHLNWMGSIPLHQSAEFLCDPQPGAFLWSDDRQHSGVVERIQELDFGTYLSEDLLVKLDRATMLASVEGRTPFLDHTLVEEMASLPTAFKLRGFDTKRVLKRAMREHLPAEILGRPKKGFGIPIADWLRGPLKPLIDEHLDPSRLASQGIFRSEPVGRLVREHLQGRADHRKPLWTLLVFQMWFENARVTL